MKGNPGWRRVPPEEFPQVETFLRRNEAAYVPACSRFLLSLQHESFAADQVWAFPAEGAVSAALIHSKRCLYPVFRGRRDLPLPGFLRRFLRKVPIHAIQGPLGETAWLEKALAGQGYRLKEAVDYDLMALMGEPREGAFRAGPLSLLVREAGQDDAGELAEIQEAYEKEEVLPAGAAFDPAYSRFYLDYILRTEQVFAALMDGRIVGKINTNARSFTMRQIGGVYVRPAYRGRGIAVHMSALFVNHILRLCRGITLYVRKQNPAARQVYRRVGFTPEGEYRISYF